MLGAEKPRLQRNLGAFTLDFNQNIICELKKKVFHFHFYVNYVPKYIKVRDILLFICKLLQSPLYEIQNNLLKCILLKSKSSVYIGVCKILKPYLGKKCETINTVIFLILHSFTFFKDFASYSSPGHPEVVSSVGLRQGPSWIQILRVVTSEAPATPGAAGQGAAAAPPTVVVSGRRLLRRMQEINDIL